MRRGRSHRLLDIDTDDPGSGPEHEFDRSAGSCTTHAGDRIRGGDRIRDDGQMGLHDRGFNSPVEEPTTAHRHPTVENPAQFWFLDVDDDLTIGHGALHSCREFTRGFGRGTGDLGNGAVIANQRLPRRVFDPRSRRPRAEHVHLDRTPMRGGVFLEGVQVFGQPGSGTPKSRLTCVAKSPAADGGFDFERSIDTGQHGGRSPDGVTSRASTRQLDNVGYRAKFAHDDVRRFTRVDTRHRSDPGRNSRVRPRESLVHARCASRGRFTPLTVRVWLILPEPRTRESL